MKPTIDEQIAMCEAEAKTYWRTTAIKSAKTHEAAADSLRNYKELVEAVEDVTDLLSIVPKEYLEKVERLGDILDKIKQSAQ